MYNLSLICSNFIAKAGACATASPFSGDFLGDFRMSKLLDKSFIHRSYPKLACGSMYTTVFVNYFLTVMHFTLK